MAEMRWNANVADATATRIDHSTGGGMIRTALASALDPATMIYSDTAS
jgi:hypothetical protein